MQMYANDVEQRHRRSGRARKVSYAPIARQMALAWRRTFPPHTKWPPSTFVMKRWPGRSRDPCKWPAEVAQAVDWSARGAWLLIELWGPRGSKCTRPIKWSIIDVIAIDRWRWIVVHCSMWTRAPVPTMWKRTENSARLSRNRIFHQLEKCVKNQKKFYKNRWLILRHSQRSGEWLPVQSHLIRSFLEF